MNGGGVIEREYALGRGRTDLLIRWPQGGRTRKFVVECKLRRRGLEPTIAEGLAQTRGYMDRCGAEAGHLIVFDRAPERRGRRRSSAATRRRTARRSPSGACEGIERREPAVSGPDGPLTGGSRNGRTAWRIA